MSARATSRASSRRILAAWLPWWPTERLARRLPEAREQPFATVAEARGRMVVGAVNLRARRAGVVGGMPLADARAVVPDLVVRPADLAGDASTLESLARWAVRFTPRVAVAGPDAFFLDIGGCAHLFNGERALADSLREGLDRLGLTSRTALANTPGAAWALARYGKEKLTVAPAAAGPEGLKDMLAELPVAALRLDPAVVEAMSSFGLDKIHALFDLESVDLGRRFGFDLPRRIDQALGLREEPLVPLRPILPREVRLAFAEPVARAEDVWAATEQLLGDLCRLLQRTGEGARRLRLVCCRVDGRPQNLVVGTSRPMRRKDRLMALFAEKLGEVDPGFGIEEMALSAEVAEPIGERQSDCWAGGSLPGGKAGLHGMVGKAGMRGAGTLDGVGSLDDEDDKLSGFLDRLGNRFGFDRVARPAPRSSWLPESAVGKGALLVSSAGSLAVGVAGWPEGRRRPLRLLSPPERVDVPADPGPGQPPARFRRGGRMHGTRFAEGPERIECEWWRDATPPRDYYMVEDESGQRWWLFREATRPPSADTPGNSSDDAPRWFLHGVFA